MNINKINQSSQQKIAFGKFQKPSESVQERINQFIIDINDANVADFLADKFVKIVDGQKNDKSSSIKIVSDYTSNHGLEIEYSEIGKRKINSEAVFNFNDLVKKMSYYASLSTANISAIKKVNDVWDA